MDSPGMTCAGGGRSLATPRDTIRALSQSAESPHPSTPPPVPSTAATPGPPRVPRFSVLIPVYDGERWIEGAIASVLDQDYADLEIVVADNASTDGTIGRVRRFSDERLRLVTTEAHVDIFDNFNRGAAACRGEWLYLLPVDDRLRAGCLERVDATIGAHRSDGRLVAVFPRAARIDEDGTRIDERYYGAQGELAVDTGTYDSAGWLAVTTRPGSPPWDSGAFRRSTILQMGTFYRADVPSMSADLELTIRVAAQGDVAYIDDPLMNVTASDGSHTPGRVRRNLAAREPFTPRGRAYAEGLAAHEAARAVAAPERRAVAAAIARTHLRRATAHRHLPGGRGRMGAIGDVMCAFQSSPATVARALPYAAATVLLPRGTLLFIRGRAISRRGYGGHHPTASGPGEPPQ